MLTLRGKVAVISSVLMALAIVTVSALEIGRATRLMVNDLDHSGAMLVAQTFEEMRAVLSNTSEQPAAALAHDRSLQALLNSSQAFGKGVSYVRVEGNDGRVILAAPDQPAASGVFPFESLQLTMQRWWPLAPFWMLWSGRVYETSKQVEINHQPFALIKVGLSTDLIASEVRKTVRDIIQIGCFAAAFGLILALLLSRVLLRPVLAITTGVEQLVTGEDEVNLAVARKDEFGTLADKFNQLSRRISADRRQWEAERGKFFNVFKSITDAILLLDSRGGVLFANTEAQGKLGLPAGGLAEGKQLALLLGKSHPLTEMISTAYTLGSEVHDVPVEIKDANRASRFLISISSLGQGPEPPGLLVVVRDLDPVQKLESVVNYSGRLARLGALISGVAHQLRNPLNAMNLQIELLSQDDELDVPIKPRLQSLRYEIMRLDQVMSALLRFMRPEELKLADTSLNDLVADLAAQVVRPPVEAKLELDPLCPSITIDRSLIGEAVRNIITNAIEAMPEGGTLTLRTGLDGNECVELSIHDQGEGIAPEHIDQIFHLYFTTKEKGNGLGLSLALRAVDLHQGTLDVESSPGQGTTIKVRLPIAAHFGDDVMSHQENHDV